MTEPASCRLCMFCAECETAKKILGETVGDMRTASLKLQAQICDDYIPGYEDGDLTPF